MNNKSLNCLSRRLIVLESDQPTTNRFSSFVSAHGDLPLLSQLIYFLRMTPNSLPMKRVNQDVQGYYLQVLLHFHSRCKQKHDADLLKTFGKELSLPNSSLRQCRVHALIEFDDGSARWSSYTIPLSVAAFTLLPLQCHYQTP